LTKPVAARARKCVKQLGRSVHRAGSVVSNLKAPGIGASLSGPLVN
jgi:hypothetical protein